MFNRRSHPARRLLDVLTEACDGNAGETPQDSEMLDRAEQAVDRVVTDYDDDQAIFELAATELRDQLDQQRKRSRSEEHTSELQSLMRNSYAVFCLKKKKQPTK